MNIDGELYNQFCSWPHVCVERTTTQLLATERALLRLAWVSLCSRARMSDGGAQASAHSHGDSGGNHSCLSLKLGAVTCDACELAHGYKQRQPWLSGTDAATVLNNIFAATVRTFRANTLISNVLPYTRKNRLDRGCACTGLRFSRVHCSPAPPLAAIPLHTCPHRHNGHCTTALIYLVTTQQQF